MDSFDYSYLAKLIYDCNLPATNLIIDLPIGYPFVIYLIKTFDLNFNHLVLFQLLTYLFSFLFLSYHLSKFTKFGGLITSFTFIFYSLDSHTIRHVFRIYPDSLYTSFLVFLIGGLFFYFRRRNRSSLIVVLSSISAAILLRSNGIYLLFLVPFFIYFELATKKKLMFLLVSLLSFFVIISSFNYKVKGVFAPYDHNRVVSLFGNFKSKKTEKDREKYDINKKESNFGVFKKYFMSFCSHHPSYYYSLQKTNYERIIDQKTFFNLNQRFFDNKISVLEADKKILGFMFNNLKTKNYEDIIDEINFENHNRNLWIYSIYIFQELLHLSKFNYLIFFVFFLCLLHSIYRKNKLLLFLFSIHLLPLFFLCFTGSYRLRYISVSEFIVFIISIKFFVDSFTILKKKIDK